MTFPEAIHFFIDETTRFISPLAVGSEWVLVIVAALVITLAPPLPTGAFRRLRDMFHSAANRKHAAVLLCGVLPVLVRLCMLEFAPVPEPSIHDEFSHLLLADTLAHGRLTNPTHPMWQHFESIHIIQKPTYNSMYPPGQGLFLAMGQVLFHDPWAGVVISVGLMGAAICWMLQGWLPPAWAFFGALIVILKIGITGLWMNSYMGGAVAAIGGGLLVGSLPRLRRGLRVLHSTLFAAGLVILMNTRPFEGGVLACAALVYLFPPLYRRFIQEPTTVIKSVLVPAGIVLSSGLLFTGYYNWRVTGNPARMPYQVNRATYGWPENLAFLPVKHVVLRHAVLEDMYRKEVHNRDAYTSLDRFIHSVSIRLFDNWTVFIGPVLTVPLVFLPWVRRDRRTRPLTIFLSVIILLNLCQLVLYPYHLGPVVAIMFAIVVQAIRHMYVSLLQFDRGRGVYFAILLPVCLILIGAMKQEAEDLGIPLAYWEHAAEPHRDVRAYIQAWLTSRPRKQLVVVRYAPDHSPNQEWVYNRADIDSSKVVWAREMDPQSNGHLLAYFKDREAWLLEADVAPQHVIPYPQPLSAGDAPTTEN